jgi:hypothetical protein
MAEASLMADCSRFIVPFPQEAVDTIECAVTGEQIPAVLVARWSATQGQVYCPVCSQRLGERVWHSVELIL